MRASPFVITALFLAAAPVRAGTLDECQDTYTECQDDCTVQYGGSIKDEAKKRIAKCLKKCTKAATICQERVVETATNHLEEGALNHAPGSDEVDEHGIPTRTSGGKAGAGDDSRRTTGDLRDDGPEPEPKAQKGQGGKAARAPREDVHPDEVVKSSRTSLGDAPPPRKEPPAVKKDEDAPRSTRTDLDAAPVREEPKPRREEPRAEPKEKHGNDEDLRDDGVRSGVAPPRKKDRDEERPRETVKPRETPRETPKETPRPKEEDHDDLRNF